MVAGAPVSLGEFLALPETEPASEYLCGEVVQKPMLDLPHSLVQSFLLTALSAFVRRARPGVCGAELRCVFGPPGQERAYLPDVCFISWSRLGRGDARASRPLRAAPELAVEVLSPDQPAGRLAETVQFYLRHGVRLVWVVDPDAETVTVLRPDADPRTHGVGDTLDGAGVLPGFTLPVAGIFAELQLPIPDDSSDRSG